jgi:hypothetical protein
MENLHVFDVVLRVKKIEPINGPELPLFHGGQATAHSGRRLCGGSNSAPFRGLRGKKRGRDRPICEQNKKRDW